MKLLYPNKPFTDFPFSIPRYSAQGSTWIPQAKLDGWRMFLTHSPLIPFHPLSYNGHYFLSRRDKDKGGPSSLDIPHSLQLSIFQLNLPPNSMLDTEFACHRTTSLTPRLYIFDVLWWNDLWMGDMPYSQRKAFLESTYKTLPTDIYFPATTRDGESLDAFYKNLQLDPYAEGMVLKHKDYTIASHPSMCKDHPLLVKIKWK